MIGRSALRSFACLCLALGMEVPAFAMEAEGVAEIDHRGIDYARHIATDDALRQLALQQGAAVASVDDINTNGTVVRSAAVRPVAPVDRYSLVREWNDEHALHVLIHADSATALPASAAQKGYKKKVLLTPFYVDNPAQVTDLDDVTNGIPRDLSQRLAQTGRFQARLSRYALPREASGHPPAQIATAVKQLALANDSQFVLAGEVTNAGAGTGDSRSFEVRTTLYDGITGTLIAEHRIDRNGTGNVSSPLNQPFGSASFFTSGFGKVVDVVLEAIARQTLDELAPLPFTATIVRVEGAMVFFDAGATSAIQPGDNLMAFGRHVSWDVGAPMQGTGEALETPLATVSVVQVQPAFSVGELQGDRARIHLKPGDFVRAMPSR